MGVQQVRGPVQPYGGLSGARCALYADRVLEFGADQLVLLRLDGGDDVPHRSDARAFYFGSEDAALRAEFLTAVEVLILEAGQLAFDEPEPPPSRDVLRIANAGPVERSGQRRPPVQHHRLPGVVGDVPAP